MAPQSQNASTFRKSTYAPLALPDPLRTWSGCASDYPRDRSVASLFEEVSACKPNNVAIVFHQDQLSYAELNRRANRIAHRLRGFGVGPEAMVGCCLDRSPELIVALLGILKAGAAYVPLDPSYPKARLDLLLDDTDAPLIITQKRIASTVLRDRNLPLLIIDDLDERASAGDDVNPVSAAGANSLAYVMYTSGSTGRPKGVLVENRAIVRLVRNTNYCDFSEDQVFLQFAPISFDASTFEIWGPLLNGAHLVIMPPGASSLEDLGKVIRTNGVTTLWLTSSLFNLMVEQSIDDLRPLRQLLAGGEVLSPRHVRTCLEALPDVTLINGYGPTENTTFTCCHVMRTGHAVDDSVPIGKPISNTQIFILDKELWPVSPGQPGELYAAGDGLARGYLSDPTETANKFVPNPFSANGEKMYRTGDLARWRHDGTVEFLGRRDDQVKILGYRIEPSEIEAALRTHSFVKQCCVLARGDEGPYKRLIGFYVPNSDSSPTPAELRQFLGNKLPQYMVPAQFIPLHSFPLTANGKIDREALAKHCTGSADDAVASTPISISSKPETRLEASLMRLWQEVLRRSPIGLDDNFFDLGGNSLLLFAMHARLRQITSSDIPVIDLFKCPTLRTLARHLKAQGAAGSRLAEIALQAKRRRQAYEAIHQQRGGGS